MVTNTVRGKAVTDLIARCLKEGSTIEIDGLGKFELQNEDVVFRPSNRIRVFLAYALEDRRMVQLLYDELQNAGFEPWMDTAKLLPGQNWPRAIQRAIEVSDFVLINFSHRSVEKRGHFQAELRYALDLANRVPLDDIFLVPVRLSDCEVPREIAERTQYVDLFPDHQAGIQVLTRMMTAQALKRSRRRRKGKKAA
jgi:TIR domain